MHIGIEYFAVATEATTDPISGLGIDARLLAFQVVAFLLLMWAINKFILPVFVRIVDERQKLIEDSTRAAVDAEKNAAEAQQHIKSMLGEARKEAADIVSTAKEESTAMISASEKKATESANRIVESAHESIEKDVIAARKALHNETVELVALATEKVVGNAVNADLDQSVIKAALKEAK